jgi:hypothetical protein
MRTSQKTPETITTIGIDLGKNTFHLVGLDKRGAIVLQLKVSRGQLGRRLSNIPRCLIGMEACSGSHHIGRQLGQEWSPQMPPDKSSLRSTKGMPATPLRYHRSPRGVSERRWLRGDGFT